MRGELLDRGGFQERVELRVANLLPFLVLKAFALADRDKAKDSYDLIWTLNAYGDGPGSAAEAAANSPVIGDSNAPAAIACFLRSECAEASLWGRL